MKDPIELLRTVDHYVNHSMQSTVMNDGILDQIVDARYSQPDSVAQIMLYGKIVDMISRPSALAEAFMEEYVVNVHPEVHRPYGGDARDLLSDQVRAGGSLEDILGRFGTLSSHKAYPPSVSMHVRQADSCDFVVNDITGGVLHYLDANGKRPCYALDIYMQRLRELKARYNVSRVYLATDSQVMIKRTLVETDFNWIYLNTNREQMGKQWVDFQPDSLNELTTFGFVGDLAILRQGDIFLGAFTRCSLLVSNDSSATC
jgi:hypothetical protein